MINDNKLNQRSSIYYKTGIICIIVIIVISKCVYSTIRCLGFESILMLLT